MSDLFGNPERLWLLALLPLLALLWWLGARARRRALRRYAGDFPAELLAPGLWSAGGRWSAALAIGAACFLVLALARPQWGEREETIVRRGVDIVIALDTSRSMACDDVRPSRFDRARLAVMDLLERRAGDRIALLPFSQDAMVSCPLTLDYGAVRLLLDAAEVGQDTGAGTDLAGAIRAARGVFEGEEKKYRVLLLVTDGEDHEGSAVQAAQEARRDGVTIFALGVGTPDGGPIPTRDESGRLLGYHRDRQEKVVTTRLDLDLLQKVAEAAGGTAFRLGPTGEEVVALGREIDGLEKKDVEGALATRREERYRWPLAVAIALLTAVSIVPPVRRPRAPGV